MGTWTLTCPNQGIYAGEGHYEKEGEGLVLKLKKVVKIKDPRKDTCEAEETENPRARGFLPHGLTACEKAHADVRRKLARCISKVELRCCGKHTTDYARCSCNPVAVCRATVPCP